MMFTLRSVPQHHVRPGHHHRVPGSSIVEAFKLRVREYGLTCEPPYIATDPKGVNKRRFLVLSGQPGGELVEPDRRRRGRIQGGNATPNRDRDDEVARSGDQWPHPVPLAS